MNDLPDRFDRIARRSGGPAPRPEAPDARPVASGGLRVLIVDDEAPARRKLRRLLDAFGEDYRDYAERTPLLLFGRGIR